MIYNSLDGTFIKVWSRHIRAPWEVVNFTRDFDQLPRGEDERPDRTHADFKPPEPFEFELPPLSDPEWQEECYGCEELFAPAGLDDEGYCEDCRKDAD